jgi:tRNA modification GTPase
MDQDTIAAIATPIGSSGIGIIRISGSNARHIGQQLFRAPMQQNSVAPNNNYCNLPAHQLKYGQIYDPQNKNLIDEVLIVYMKAPKSYTCEDVIEIQSHGGPVVMRKLLDLVVKSGARLAEPGEFTKRAYLNGRIDLSQAEAVADVISAKSDAALQIAAGQLAGRMKTTITSIISKINAVQAEIEARIEFCEDIEDDAETSGLCKTIREGVITPISTMIEDYQKGYVFRDGLRLDIVGRPNVGKSSLLNQLIRKDKAIVTPIPGTTRDLIEEYFCIGGIPILITDTAGLHSTEDPVEIIGIQKTRDNILRSDLVLFVVDGSVPFKKEDEAVYEHITAKNVILVINKSDLMPAGNAVELAEKYYSLPSVIISALHGDGIYDLERTIKEVTLNGIFINPGRHLVPTMRQKIALEKAKVPLTRACKCLADGLPDELVTEDLDIAKRELNLILGETVEADVLDEIFSKFCIGK